MAVDKNKLDKYFDWFFKDINLGEIFDIHDLNVFYSNNSGSGPLNKEDVEYLIDTYAEKNNIEILSNNKFRKIESTTNNIKFTLSERDEEKYINKHNFEYAKQSLIYYIKLIFIAPFLLVIINYIMGDKAVPFSKIMYNSAFMWMFIFTIAGPTLIYFFLRMYLPRKIIFYRWILSFLVSLTWVICLYFFIYIFKTENNTFEYMGGFPLTGSLVTIGMIVLRLMKYSKP